jgi:hypothetical protein
LVMGKDLETSESESANQVYSHYTIPKLNHAQRGYSVSNHPLHPSTPHENQSYPTYSNITVLTRIHSAMPHLLCRGQCLSRSEVTVIVHLLHCTESKDTPVCKANTASICPVHVSGSPGPLDYPATTWTWWTSPFCVAFAAMRAMSCTSQLNDEATVVKLRILYICVPSASATGSALPTEGTWRRCLKHSNTLHITRIEVVTYRRSSCG